MLRRGDRGPAVAEVRAHLAQLGYLATDVPGGTESSSSGTTGDGAASDGTADFDDEVEQAVRAFQQERGIPVDGICGPVTLRRLDEARWQLGDRVLRFAPGHLMRGDDIAALQRRLNELGFDAGRADGIFGRQTEIALRELQRGVGCEPDGICGPTTFTALDRLARTVAGGNAARLRDRLHLDSLRTGIAGKTVVVDSGDEPECRAVASRVEGRLAALGTQVLLTGTQGAAAGAESDRDRASLANRTGADLVISIHVVEAPNPAPHGIATYYYGDPRGIGAASAAGQALAREIQDSLVGGSRALDCRTHPRTWDLLRMTRMPAVRIELGYRTNPEDAARLADPAQQDRAAEAIAGAIARFCQPRTEG